MRLFLVQWDQMDKTGDEFVEGVALVRAESEANASAIVEGQLKSESSVYNVHEVQAVDDAGEAGLLSVLSW